MAFTSLFLIFTLVPLPSSALPVTPSTITVHWDASTPIDYGVIFDIAFALALFFACLGSFVWLASRWTAGAQPADFWNRLCAIPIAISQQLSVFCRSTFIERAAASDNANAASVPRRGGGASYPVASIPGGPQNGVPKWVGIARGSSVRPGGIVPSTQFFD